MDDVKLRALAPEATHQHRKGGLYRDLGIARDADTMLAMCNAQGIELRAWQHVHPHEVQVLMRGVDEDDRFLRIS